MKRRILLVVCLFCVGFLLTAFDTEDSAEDEYGGVFLPVLMYHQITPFITDSEWEISRSMFWRQMQFLWFNGFNTITIAELIEYVFGDGELPDNPVLVTFDDGYLNVYRYAFPVLEHFGHRAVTFVIGHNVGQSTYKDTGFLVTPKFSFADARNMLHVMDIQSHSFDMHQWPYFEAGRARENMLRWYDECVYEFTEILKNDHKKISSLIYRELGIDVVAVAFPGGRFDELVLEILVDLGVKVTFRSTPGTNMVMRGEPASLHGLRRINMTDQMDEGELMRLLRPE